MGVKVFISRVPASVRVPLILLNEMSGQSPEHGTPEGTATASTLTPHGMAETQRGDAVRQVERCALTAKHITPMTYIRDLERELRVLLEEGDEARVIRFVKEKALESYRNGLDATSLRVGQAAKKLEQSVRAS